MYKHIVQYYETDKMGIAHHSNYIRWMEEARVDFLDRLGWGYDRFEAEGLISPVTAVQCHYRKSTTFSDEVNITISVLEFRGVKFKLGYTMTNKDGDIVCEAESEHCFLGKDGRPVRLDRTYPDFYTVIRSLLPENEK